VKVHTWVAWYLLNIVSPISKDHNGVTALCQAIDQVPTVIADPAQWPHEVATVNADSQL